MADLRIRTARSDDVPSLHSLIERAYRGESAKAGWTHEADLLGGQRTDQDALMALIADPNQRMLIMLDDAAPVGCAAITQKGDALSYIGMITVDPAHQAAGIGRKLIAAAEALAQTVFAARTMEMTVIAQRSELIAWYERRGYSSTGERRPFPYGDVRFGAPRRDDLYFVVMSRRLSTGE